MWSMIAFKSLGSLGEEGTNNPEVIIRSRKIFIAPTAPGTHEVSVWQDGEKMPPLSWVQDSDRIQAGIKGEEPSDNP